MKFSYFNRDAVTVRDQNLDLKFIFSIYQVMQENSAMMGGLKTAGVVMGSFGVFRVMRKVQSTVQFCE